MVLLALIVHKMRLTLNLMKINNFYKIDLKIVSTGLQISLKILEMQGLKSSFRIRMVDLNGNIAVNIDLAVLIIIICRVILYYMFINVVSVTSAIFVRLYEIRNLMLLRGKLVNFY